MVLEGEVLKVHNFLVSLELHVEVTSYFINYKHVHKHAYYYKLMDNNKKSIVKNICRKAFNKEFYFAYVDDIIIILSKENRKNTYLEDNIKNS